MKLKVLLLILLLSGCSVNNSLSTLNTNTLSATSSFISEISSESNKESYVSSSISSSTSLNKESDINSSISSSTFTNSSNSTILSESSIISSSSSSSIKEESSSSSFNACLDKPGGKNEDGSDKLPIPCNKDNKIVIGNDNASMTSFDFTSSLPDYFRAIYGNNFDNGKDLFYSSEEGGFRIKMGGSNDPSRGIQTAMFESNLKLEIRLRIGEMFNNSKGNEVDKDKPVIVIYAFDELGNYLRKVEIETLNKNNEKGTIKKYMNGEEVAYLEIRSLQCAYKSSQGYNYALKGLDLIAWPYAYND